MGPRSMNRGNAAHPLIQHKLTILRDARTGHKEFRELVEEVAMLLAFEATRTLPGRPVDVHTPLGVARGVTLTGQELAVVPIGIYRDPASLTPHTYHCKLPPDIGRRQALVVDPMLATGGSAVESISLLKAQAARRVSLLILIAAPEGIR